MTVAELIEELKGMPAGWRVFLGEGEGEVNLTAGVRLGRATIYSGHGFAREDADGEPIVIID